MEGSGSWLRLAELSVGPFVLAPASMAASAQASGSGGGGQAGVPSCPPPRASPARPGCGAVACLHLSSPLPGTGVWDDDGVKCSIVEPHCTRVHLKATGPRTRAPALEPPRFLPESAMQSEVSTGALSGQGTVWGWPPAGGSSGRSGGLSTGRAQSSSCE